MTGKQAVKNHVRARTVFWWSAGLAGLLLAQTAIISGLFAVFLTVGKERDTARELNDFCGVYSALTPSGRAHELRELIERDVHRRYLVGLRQADGTFSVSNILSIPSKIVAGSDPDNVDVTRTEPEQIEESAVVAKACDLSDGEVLFVGIDQGQASEALELAERSFLTALVPAILVALLGGIIIGNRATDRVEMVRLLANRIISGHLNERLPVADRPDSFDRLCSHINGMLDRIETLMGEVRGVGDDIAHQLRTPLTRLQTKLERVAEEAERGEIPVEASREALLQCRKALSIAASLLRIRELDDRQRRASFGPVELEAIVKDVVDLYGPTAEDSGIALHATTEPLNVEGDRDLLMEAIANLVDNALKFGPKGGRVDIVLERKQNTAHIAVIDDGPGIPENECHQIGQRFYRSQNAFDVDGVGLGLALVSAIATLHDFRFTAHRDRQTDRNRAELIGPAANVR